MTARFAPPAPKRHRGTDNQYRRGADAPVKSATAEAAQSHHATPIARGGGSTACHSPCWNSNARSTGRCFSGFSAFLYAPSECGRYRMHVRIPCRVGQPPTARRICAPHDIMPRGIPCHAAWDTVSCDANGAPSRIDEQLNHRRMALDSRLHSPTHCGMQSSYSTEDALSSAGGECRGRRPLPTSQAEPSREDARRRSKRSLRYVLQRRICMYRGQEASMKASAPVHLIPSLALYQVRRQVPVQHSTRCCNTVRLPPSGRGRTKCRGACPFRVSWSGSGRGTNCRSSHRARTGPRTEAAAESGRMPRGAGARRGL